MTTTTYDVRYEYLTCERCKCEVQVMDWNGTTHQSRCGKDPRAILTVTDVELEQAAADATPSTGVLYFDLFASGYRRPLACHIAIASACLARRNGVACRVS